MDRTITIRVKRRWLRFAVVAAALGLVAGPGSVWAYHSFADVPADAYYHEDATALRDAGVTLGCTADGSRYCPDDFVTRGQMASFLNRLGALSPDKQPVVNADKLDGKDATEFLTTSDLPLSGTKAVDSDRLDGKDSSEFLSASGKAVDSERLDGRDSSEFVLKGEPVAHASNADAVNGLSATELATVMVAFEADNSGDQSLEPITSRDFTPLANASKALHAPTSCMLLLNGTLDWDDGGTKAVLDVQWFVNGVAVGPEFSGQIQNGGEHSNYSIGAIAFLPVDPGEHLVELRAQVRQDGQRGEVESLAGYAMCIPTP
ncbi:MAG: hypothetical protein M3N51_06155 [Actinomycetota bacterium]|nr:hypothetical protein [Actinomycetota bacterium]